MRPLTAQRGFAAFLLYMRRRQPAAAAAQRPGIEHTRDARQAPTLARS